MRGSRAWFILTAMADRIRSGDALIAFDRELQVVSWNHAAEQLTGIAATDAIGRPCWDVLRGIDDRGDLVCHVGCSGARLMREGWPVGCQVLQIATGRGTRKTVSVSTISVAGREGPLFVHLLKNGDEYESSENGGARRTRLTERQIEVLRLMAEGLPAKRIADRLGIAEPTVRNHIRAILVELSAHSQLEALAKARKLGLII